jgi:MFS family permease
MPSFLGPLIGSISDKYGRKWLATSGFLLAVPVEVLFRLVTHGSISQKVLMVVLLALLGLSIALIVTPITAELTIVAERLQRAGKLGSRGAYAQVSIN